eukprot:scaffold29965_cov18-Tisochrysis_lutea.AAC.2
MASSCQTRWNGDALLMCPMSFQTKCKAWQCAAHPYVWRRGVTREWSMKHLCSVEPEIQDEEACRHCNLQKHAQQLWQRSIAVAYLQGAYTSNLEAIVQLKDLAAGGCRLVHGLLAIARLKGPAAGGCRLAVLGLDGVACDSGSRRTTHQQERVRHLRSSLISATATRALHRRLHGPEQEQQVGGQAALPWAGAAGRRTGCTALSKSRR